MQIGYFRFLLIRYIVLHLTILHDMFFFSKETTGISINMKSLIKISGIQVFFFFKKWQWGVDIPHALS